MSGIAGLYSLDGRPVEFPVFSKMLALLHRRGPDGSAAWLGGPVALGQTSLETTPESKKEPLPLVLRSGKLVITADARLDNRAELIERFGLRGSEPDAIGDGALIARAYEEWGERCPNELLGDFVFAIWDADRKALFCARDPFGVRPLYFHSQPGRLFALSSEPSAILSLPEVPYRLNEGRIADFLVTQLEGIDTSCTFFEGISRLPPAHAMRIDARGVRRWRYWCLETGSMLRLSSDEAYAEAFLDLFTDAVHCRLRGAGTVGSMLSGGMDSGAVVAVASRLLSESGQGPLPVYSAVGPDHDDCVETRTILAAQTMAGLDPHTVNHADLSEYFPELAEQTWGADEPFDSHMTLVRALYLCARRSGTKAVLDGIDGDTLLGEGSYLARLVRSGRWLTAYREAVGQDRFWQGAYPAWRELGRSASHAFAPAAARRILRSLRGASSAARLQKNIEASIISPDFAQRIHLRDRLLALESHTSPTLQTDYGTERARAMSHPYLTAGAERYGRTASALGIEPRHPLLDRRLVEFCVTLPGDQKLRNGWPKAILRSAMNGRVPDAVRWRRGKQHLGWAFTNALIRSQHDGMRRAIEEGMEPLTAFADIGKVQAACHAFLGDGNGDQAHFVFEALSLLEWLRRNAERPPPPEHQPFVALHI